MEFTSRQFEIGKLVSRGLTNKEIAEEMGVCEATIKQHLFIIFKKLDITNRVQLAIKYRDSEMYLINQEEEETLP